MSHKNDTIDHIDKAISKIDWSAYDTAYGNAAQNHPYSVPLQDNRGYMPKVAQSLKDLFSDNKDIALQASHDLWCDLCHQHTFISSASLPAYDILYDGLQILDTTLKVEILDIFYGFAICTTNEASPNSWQAQLRTKLKNNIDTFAQLTTHPNEDIVAFAENILSALQQP